MQCQIEYRYPQLRGDRSSGTPGCLEEWIAYGARKWLSEGKGEC